MREPPRRHGPAEPDPLARRRARPARRYRSPVDVAHLKTGCRVGAPDPRNLEAGRYLDVSALPTPPPSWSRISQRVRTWPVYANDRLNDCTTAAVGTRSWRHRAGPATSTCPGVGRRGALLGDRHEGRRPLPERGAERVAHGDRRSRRARSRGLRRRRPRRPGDVRTAAYLFAGVYICANLPANLKKQLAADRPTWSYVPGAGSAPGSWDGQHSRARVLRERRLGRPLLGQALPSRSDGCRSTSTSPSRSSRRTSCSASTARTPRGSTSPPCGPTSRALTAVSRPTPRARSRAPPRPCPSACRSPRACGRPRSAGRGTRPGCWRCSRTGRPRGILGGRRRGVPGSARPRAAVWWWGGGAGMWSRFWDRF